MIENDTQTSREITKLRHSHYRKAARVLFGLNVNPHTTVNETADQDGAFLEGTIYVSREQAMSVRDGDLTPRAILKNEILAVVHENRARLKRGGGQPARVKAVMKQLNRLIHTVTREL